MSHTYVQNLLHVVFSTKERRKLIPLDYRTKLWAYMAGVCSKEKIVPHEIGGMDDHSHLLIQLPPTWSLSDAVQEIKTSSSRWMGKDFFWQRGFAAFSASASNKDTVVRYIRTQDAHHKKIGLQIRIDRSLGKTRRALRPEICFRLACVAPTALTILCTSYPRRCRGLTCRCAYGA
jgi:REP element-mobilizing transposase RayT